MPERVMARRPAILNRSGPRRHKPDYILILISVLLLVFGLIVVYAISPGLAAQKGVGENFYATKQLIAVGLGVAAFAVTSVVPFKSWRGFEKPLIIAAVLASIAVRLFGEEVNGAYRWVQLAGLSFQAVELIKFALIIWLAGFLADRLRKGRLDASMETFKPILYVLCAITFIVAVLQSDLGSTIVLLAMVVAMCFIAGLPLKRVAMLGVIMVVGALLLISASAYRRERVLTYLQPTRDCEAAGYQACQALIAVGSGGMFGQGLASSGQAYGYLPEAANDSIFAIIAEKFGFVGVTLLICLFLALFSRLVRIMERAPDNFSRFTIAGILAWLSTQAFINIGAMIGLLPLKGITLPFVSYGGTSILFVCAAVGIAFNVSRYTTYSVNEGAEEPASPGKRQWTTRRPTVQRSSYGR